MVQDERLVQCLEARSASLFLQAWAIVVWQRGMLYARRIWVSPCSTGERSFGVMRALVVALAVVLCGCGDKGTDEAESSGTGGTGPGNMTTSSTGGTTDTTGTGTAAETSSGTAGEGEWTTGEVGTTTSGTTGGSETGGDPLPYFALAQGENGSGVRPELKAIVPGDRLRLVLGSQGALMFPIIVLGDHFVLPDPPENFIDPVTPQLNVFVEIEGEDDHIGGFYARTTNYPLRFRYRPDGSYESIFYGLIAPDDPGGADRLQGRAARITANLETWRHGLHEGNLQGDDQPLTWAADVIIEVEG